MTFLVRNTWHSVGFNQRTTTGVMHVIFNNPQVGSEVMSHNIYRRQNPAVQKEKYETDILIFKGTIGPNIKKIQFQLALSWGFYNS